MYFPGKYTIRYLLLILRNGVHYTKLHLALMILCKFLFFAPLTWINEIILFIKLRNQDHSEIPVVFVLGYWRSATSYLQEQLALHLDYNTIQIYDILFPEHTYLTKRFLLTPLNKVVKMLNVPFDVQRTQMDLKKNAEEELALLGLGNPNSLVLFHFFPKLYPIIQSEDQKSRYIKSYVKMIQWLYLSDRSKGIVLKSPTNLSCIQQLAYEFPNAKYIYIQREKEAVIKSNKYLWSLIRKRTSFHQLSDDRIDYIINDSYNQMLSDYKRDRRLIEKSLIELDFEELCESPEITIKQIQNQFDFV
jgi:omega-hydroxy-beta-dihydromenaquinone-9 sulfotransferase